MGTIQGKGAKAAKASGSMSANPAPAEYSGPNGETWKCRGLAPKWLAALVAEGHSKDEYLINK
jgi:DNA-binding protein H-NS